MQQRYLWESWKWMEALGAESKSRCHCNYPIASNINSMLKELRDEANARLSSKRRPKFRRHAQKVRLVLRSFSSHSILRSTLTTARAFGYAVLTNKRPHGTMHCCPLEKDQNLLSAMMEEHSYNVVFMSSNIQSRPLPARLFASRSMAL